MILFSPPFQERLFSQSLTKHFNPPKLSGLFQTFDHTRFPDNKNHKSATEEGFFPTLPSEELKNRTEQTFAAMIYGYRFYLVPNSLLHRVKREFGLSLQGRIDPQKIQFEPSVPEENFTHSSKVISPIEFLATYSTSSFESRRRGLWNQSHFFNCQSTGALSFDQEKENLYNDVIELAIRNGLVHLFQEKLINKPRRIEGTLVLVAPPRLFYENRMLHAQVHFLVDEKEVSNYLLP